MDLEKLEHNIQKLVDELDKESFIYDLLLAYDFPKATITRLKNGDRNQSKNSGEIIWKKNLCFTDKPDGDLFACIDALKDAPAVKKHHPRFIVVTDYETFLAIDTKTEDSLDIPISELPKRANFFLPWANMEKSAITSEKLADIKAAEKMGQLYDLLLQNNEIKDKESWHALNVFLSRLLFCFFAEDTGIFEDDQFTKLIDSHTVEDGSNIRPLLDRLFSALNMKDRSDYPDYIQAFPYVNGGLFADKLLAPVFSRKARRMLIDCGSLNWKAINPDIFGSMMQAVTHGEERSSIGMHYTSVVNIMKVIEPLFLNNLKEELEKADNNEKKLERLLDRLYHIRIFDPACGSGNFLIIAYKELCRLEIEIFQQLQVINPSKWSVARSGIQLNQFYGIEIDDFAVETARLSLWLVEHQMNLEFKSIFGDSKSTLPLQDSGNIVCDNATRRDWVDVCPLEFEHEVFLLGNPPYIGSKNQEKTHKGDLKVVASKLKGYGILDYVSCWFIKAAEYIFDAEINVRCAFVATSSITQGEQVAVLWPYILRRNLEINFAVTAFNWTNNARNNAGVHCVIIGLGVGVKKKYLYTQGIRREVNRISPYLIPGNICIVGKRTKSLSNFPNMGIGNKPIDNGNYLFNEDEKNDFIKKEPTAVPYFYRWYGGREYAGGLVRWCLLPQRIPDDELNTMPAVKKLVNNVKEFRLASSSKPTIKLAQKPKNFHVENFPDSTYLVIQKVSTGRREYIPVGVFDKDSISSDLLNVIDSSDMTIFGVISSRMHMVWLSAVGGRFRDGFRYSSSLSYNTFPFPEVNPILKSAVEGCALNVLDEREKYPDKTIAELYDPDTMPVGLQSVHKELDIAIEKCYRKKPFEDDAERLKFLFDLYEEMIQAENR